MQYYARALELNKDTVANRRYLHAHAEVGLNLPQTKAYVMEKLKEYGLDPKPCGEGITATLGKGGKCILLRADMDGLPMAENSGEPFSCASGRAMHACGHDLHTSMLLTAARLLKENEGNLRGTVKFMFQPAEETFQGAINMVDNGILENPKPDAVLAYHVGSGRMAPGGFSYNRGGTMMFSVDGFKITVTGKGAHGAYPQTSVDPINIAIHIYQGMQSIIAREVDPKAACVMTVGTFHAGTANNIIPNEAEMTGTIRSNDEGYRQLMKRRLAAMADMTAKAYGAEVQVQWTCETPALVCNPELVDAMVSYMEELNVPGMNSREGVSASGSEDFAELSSRIPGVFMYLAAGFPELENPAPSHNPGVRFNEGVLPIGAAGFAHCATRWLEENQG